MIFLKNEPQSLGIAILENGSSLLLQVQGQISAMRQIQEEQDVAETTRTVEL